MNFTWWVNRMDPEGNHLFAGGFLGLDNISAIDRSHLPAGGRLEQADGTSWMAFYSLTLLEMARILAEEDDRWTDIEVKFIEHFVLIVDAMHSQGLWDEEDGFFYDVFHAADGTHRPDQGPIHRRGPAPDGDGGPRTRPAGDAGNTSEALLGFPRAGRPRRSGVESQPSRPGSRHRRASRSASSRRERSAASWRESSTRDEFLSPHGLRALSKYHDDHPLWVDLAGTHVSVDYEPAESHTGMFGGNSNWRGPVWMPVNYLVLRNLQRYARSLGATAEIEYPTGSGHTQSLALCADDLRERLISLFLRGPDGRRPCNGWVDKLQDDPRWRDNIAFNEYFHGDNGAGLGASHQTGWTGLVADLICRPDPFAGRPWEL